MGRMAEVKQGASVLRRYAYNAWGEQVSKKDGTEAGATLTLYDEAGHWLGDYSATGQPPQQPSGSTITPLGCCRPDRPITWKPTTSARRVWRSIRRGMWRCDGT
jgi:hypothetical protein